MAQANSNDSTTLPAAPSRRRFLSQAAGVAAGSAALALATIPPASAAAAPTGLPALTKAIDIDSARPELRDAVHALDRAYDAMKAADEKHQIAWKLWGTWEAANPRPGSPRAYRKWDRRADAYQEQIGFDASLWAEAEARKRYEAEQWVLAHVRAKDFDEIAIKSAASMACEGGFLDDGFLDGDGKRPPPHHLRMAKQIVAFSVAFDAVLLAADVKLAPTD